MRIKVKIILTSLLFLTSLHSSQYFIAMDLGTTPSSKIYLEAHNQLNRPVKDVLISIPIETLLKKYPDFNVNAFIVFDGEKEIPSQTEDTNGDATADNILALVDFLDGETKTILIEYGKTAVIKKEFKKRTHAELSIKTDYVLENGYYTQGKFESIEKSIVPANHFAHDALYKYEGPGWESEKVAYRYYLDSRNRNDIFGKKCSDLILNIVGKDDLISDGNESYTQMCDWGMDIFKVGESLGIGSIAIWKDDRVNTISNTESTTCKITNDGLIKSNILTKYQNTKVGNTSFDILSLISIHAGSRLTRVDLTISDSLQVFCTGIAKHLGCSLIADNKNLRWGYIASYGKQSLDGSNLGLAIFYKKSDLIKNTEDDLSFISVLKPTGRKLTYYFTAVWEKEMNGIRSQEEFVKYIDNIISELSFPIKIKLL